MTKENRRHRPAGPRSKITFGLWRMGCPIKTIWIEQVVPLKKIKVVLPEKEVMVTEQETESSNQTNINKKHSKTLKKILDIPRQ